MFGYGIEKETISSIFMVNFHLISIVSPFCNFFFVTEAVSLHSVYTRIEMKHNFAIGIIINCEER